MNRTPRVEHAVAASSQVLPGESVGLRDRPALAATGVMVCLLAAAASLVYANSLLNGFALDDTAVIAGNDRVHQLSDLRAIWLTPYWPDFGWKLGVYRPMVVFGWAIQWAVGGGEPWLFHAVNVLLHAGVTLLVFFLLRRFVPAIPAAVGALIFAVHPVHTEVVANGVGQSELLVAAALVGACLVHASRPPGVVLNWSRRSLILALYLVGLFAKESAIVLPGLLVLVDFAQGRIDLSRRGMTRYGAAMLMPLMLLLSGFAFYSVGRVIALDGLFMGADTGPQLGFLKEHRLLNAFRAFPEYARLLFFPAQLSADYSPAVILPVDSLTPMAALGLLLFAGLLVLALLTPWLPAVGFPAAWFLIGISVVSNLLFPIGVLVAERTLYLPSVAVAFVAAHAWSRVTSRLSGRRRTMAVLGLAAIVLAMGVRSWSRNPDWDSTPTIFASLVRDYPESYRSQWALAETFENAGDPRRASMHYETAQRFYPHNSELMAQYGKFLLEQKRHERAVELLEASYRMHPRVMRTASALAYAYLITGRYADALPVIRLVEELGAPRAYSMALRAYAYEALGLPDRSAGAWRVALREPGVSTWRNWSFLARALARAGYKDQALAAATTAASLAGDSAAVRRVSRLTAALRAGCYDPGPASEASARPPLPASHLAACDPLGDWLKDVPAQTVAMGQGARPDAPRRP
jgi:tetratricopeptide (TPR) repeat protein